MNIHMIVDSTKPLARGFLEDFGGQEGRRKAIRCSLSGCVAFTIMGRPFCTKHIEHMPYMQALAEKLSRVTEQDTIREILAYLAAAEYDFENETPAQRGSLPQIAHRLALPKATVVRLVETLADEGRLQLLKGRRGKGMYARTLGHQK